MSGFLAKFFVKLSTLVRLIQINHSLNVRKIESTLNWETTVFRYFFQVPKGDEKSEAHKKSTKTLMKNQKSLQNPTVIKKYKQIVKFTSYFKKYQCVSSLSIKDLTLRKYHTLQYKNFTIYIEYLFL